MFQGLRGDKFGMFKVKIRLLKCLCNVASCRSVCCNVQGAVFLWVQSVAAHGQVLVDKQFPSMRDMDRGMGFPRMRFPKFPKLTAQDFAGGTVRTFCS